MTFQEAYHDTKDWKRRVHLVFMYHNAKKFHNKNWRVTDSAKYFGVPISIISEALTLNEHWDLIKDCESRNQALMRLKNGRNVETNES